MTRAIARDPIYGSGASRDFWPVKTPWRIEGPQAENPKSLISSRFPSLTRVTRGASATERGLLSADAPEPGSLRRAELEATAACSHDGHLRCEVPGCRFDFESVYGEVEAGFAEVHHLRPLAEMDGSVETTLDVPAVVCANCHRMLHLGGECRAMKGLVKK